ncbi:MAG: YigZ family protein [Campylobacterota bacterium]
MPIYTVHDTYKAQIEVKRSKFKAYIVPFSLFADYNGKLREQNPKASHVVWAYRHLNDHDQMVENCSDDGEPKNSSAPPVLNVMRGRELTECAVLVVRYFGGIKLGIGGLVRAYKDSALAAVDAANLTPYEQCRQFVCRVAYPEFGKYEYLLTAFGLSAQNDFGAHGVDSIVCVPLSQKDAFFTQASLIAQDIKTADIVR